MAFPSASDILTYMQDLDLQDYPQNLLVLCATAVAACPVLKYIMSNRRLAAIEHKIKARQAKRNIEKIWDSVLLHRQDFDASIVELSFKDLHAGLQSGKLKAWDVVMAYTSKALEQTELTNCVVEFLEDAQWRAKILDQLPADERGPLHGIPISIKEDVVLKGHDSTLGMSSFIGQKYSEDSVLLTVLVQNGANPFVRTNLSQAKLSCECSNPVYGVTTNPKDKTRTSGGSSGGEGAMIGGGASILGVGCDMGGSIRIPAHCCGVAGFKATPDRISNFGNHPAGLGIKTISEVFSPLGRDVDALVQFMRAATGRIMNILDPTLPKLPFNEEMFTSKESLIIGYYAYDGCIEPTPAVMRAMALAVNLLAKSESGHKLVPFSPPKVPYMFEKLFLPTMCGDKLETLNTLLENDLTDPTLKSFVEQFQCSGIQFLKKLMSFFGGGNEHQSTKAMQNIKPPSNVGEWWELNLAVDAYKRMFINQMQEIGIDCLICPTLPMPAWPLNSDRAMETLSYTSLFNVLGFPAGVVPTSKVERSDVAKMKSYPETTSLHKFIIDSSQDSEGLPIGVQCVGLPFEDESVLRLMKELETAVASVDPADVDSSEKMATFFKQPKIEDEKPVEQDQTTQTTQSNERTETDSKEEAAETVNQETNGAEKQNEVDTTKKSAESVEPVVENGEDKTSKDNVDDSNVETVQNNADDESKQTEDAQPTDAQPAEAQPAETPVQAPTGEVEGAKPADDDEEANSIGA